jgi:putative Holliday junction resolvase
MRFLGLDFGQATIGVAVSDPDGRVATGLTTLRRDAPEALRANLRALKTIIREYGVGTLVLGYPKNMDNTLSERCSETLVFKEKLERFFKNVPVTLWDERLSTRAVSRVFSGGKKRYDAYVDEMAAVYILQGFLNYQNNTNMEAFMENEREDTTITMYDEIGRETHFDILAAKKIGDDLYWLLSEQTENEDEAEVFHYKCILTNADEMTFELIDDEHDEFENMLELFKEDYIELGIEID